MKKSQMIAEIASVLRDTDLLSENDRAMAVLSKIESLGMKPPVEEVCPVIFETKHVWENENIDMEKVVRAEIPGTTFTADEIRRGGGE